MKKNRGYMVLFLLGSNSLFSMQQTQQQPQQDENLVINLLKVGYNKLFAEQPKSELDIFPLDKSMGEADSFDEIFAFACEGKLEYIKAFCDEYNNLKEHSDSAGLTLIDYAATGYIQGKDSWSAFAYLLGAQVPLSGGFLGWLEQKEGSLYSEVVDEVTQKVTYEKVPDFSLKASRMKQILKVLERKRKFKPTDEDPFYSVPETPPYVAIESEPQTTSLFSSGFSYAALMLGAAVGSYFYTTKQLNTTTNTTTSIVPEMTKNDEKK